MTLNQNWARWIFASITKHFNDNRQGLVLHIEGTHRDTNTETDLCELRIDGPWFNEVSKDYWIIRLEVNILVQVTMNDSNFHKIHTNVGIMASAFTDIEVKKYGDDDSLLFCLQLEQKPRNRSNDAIIISHFGQLDPNIKIQQATIEGHYEGTIVP